MVKAIEDFNEFIDEYIEMFEELDQREQLQTILELGQELEEMPSEFKIKENKVHGCVSEVFIASKFEDNQMIYFGESAALVVKGYVAFLIEALSGLSPQDVLNVDSKLEEFSSKTNIKAALSASRANAFGNIITLMKEQAKKHI